LSRKAGLLNHQIIYTEKIVNGVFEIMFGRIDIIWWGIFLIGCWISVIWIGRASTVIWFLNEHRLTKKARSLPEPSEWPLVSVVVPARNEEEEIERCLRSLLGMDYPVLEIIAVDDDSSDQTGVIMERLARQDERLKVIHLKELPEGWLGKTHAMFKGTQLAKGEFILFTDGNVFFEPETLQLAMRYMIHNKFDNINLYPQPIRSNYWGNAMTDFFVMMYLVWSNPKKISNSSSKAYGGMGQFILVKRTAYEKAGGLNAIRRRIVEDFALARLLKHSGARQDMLLGNDLLRFTWGIGLKGFMNIVKKNAFAAHGYSLKRLFSITVNFILKAILPYVMLFILRDARILGYALSVLIIHGLFGYVGFRLQSGWRSSLAFPFCVTLLLWAWWRSAVITIRQGGVRWRDRFFSLEFLRDNSSQ